MEAEGAMRSVSASGEAAMRRFESTHEEEEQSVATHTEQATHTPSITPDLREHISLKVVNQNGAEVYFKIKKKTAMKKLFDAYCARQAISSRSVRFLYDGQRITDEQSPELLEMEDDDIIDAVLQQIGGDCLLYM